MRKREKYAVDAVRDVLLRCPPTGGARTTTIEDLSRYASMMARLTRPACRVLECLLLGESYSGELQEDVQALREALQRDERSDDPHKAAIVCEDRHEALP